MWEMVFDQVLVFLAQFLAPFPIAFSKLSLFNLSKFKYLIGT